MNKTTGKACEQDRGCATKVGLIETVIGTPGCLVLWQIEQEHGDSERAGTTGLSLGLSGMVSIEWPSFSLQLAKVRNTPTELGVCQSRISFNGIRQDRIGC